MWPLGCAPCAMLCALTEAPSAVTPCAALHLTAGHGACPRSAPSHTRHLPHPHPAPPSLCHPQATYGPRPPLPLPRPLSDPRTPHPAPRNPHPAPYTLHPAPCTPLQEDVDAEWIRSELYEFGDKAQQPP
jgi:hypothetical protein